MSRSPSFAPRDEDDRAAEVADWMAERATGRYLMYELVHKPEKIRAHCPAYFAMKPKACCAAPEAGSCKDGGCCMPAGYCWCRS